MLENYLIDCCSPTLASLKSGSLFNCRFPNVMKNNEEVMKNNEEVMKNNEEGTENIEECIEKWNESFDGTGIRMYLLRKTANSALIYVFRESALGRTLKDPEIKEFLGSFGYDCCNGCNGCTACSRAVEDCLVHLRSRITGSSLADGEGDGEMKFPHEIGIFLDYPLQDVKGFINNEGKNCKYTGIWKVYGDEAGAKKKFAKYEKCQNVYSRLWRSGRRSILELTVAG